MIDGVSEELHRLKAAGHDVIGDVVSLSSTHAALFEIEMKAQVNDLVRGLALAALALMACSVACVFSSFAIAGAVEFLWPEIGKIGAYLLVAIMNLAVAVGLLAITFRYLQRVSLLNLESINSWKESLVCALRKV